MPEPEPLTYATPEPRGGPGAYIAAAAAVLLACVIGLACFAGFDWRFEVSAGGGTSGAFEFPLWFRVVASTVLGLVGSAALSGLVSLGVALVASARHAALQRR